MVLYQRCFFALSIFALSFIFFYEARGARLVGWSGGEAELADAARYSHFRQNMAIGILVLVLGALLMVLLRRFSKRSRFTAWELTAYALGVGILIGTAYVSWVKAGL